MLDSLAYSPNSLGEAVKIIEQVVLVFLCRVSRSNLLAIAGCIM